MGGRRSVSVEVLIELVTRINGEKEPTKEGQKGPRAVLKYLPRGEVKLKSSLF